MCVGSVFFDFSSLIDLEVVGFCQVNILALHYTKTCSNASENPTSGNEGDEIGRLSKHGRRIQKQTKESVEEKSACVDQRVSKIFKIAC